MDRLIGTLAAMTPQVPIADASATGAASPGDDPLASPAPAPQMMLLDFFFPGFSVFSTAVQKYLKIDLNLYIPLVLLCGALTFVWNYFSEYAWNQIEAYLMSVVDIRTDDEIYNMLMTWVASQRFAQGARRFVVNTNLSSRSWFLYRWDDDDDDEEGGEEDYSGRKQKKALAYTPTFGSHWFWYKGRLLIFRRTQGQAQGYLAVSEKEEISISCFGRNPWVLKELLHEARATYIKRDEAKTLIYRGTTRSGSTEPTWQRCMSRASRPFSTVILNEKVKQDLINDVTDYLDPNTRRWYSNRGIPYRRGYLLYGPPGTGKSSLSLALAGFFKMRIYIVSLSSVTSNEENLASLFAELPRRCVVLLEDIDTAGLTHTREGDTADTSSPAVDEPTAMVPGQLTPGTTTTTTTERKETGRLSLSGLLNILDGVASQEGRVLIMTTNHLEKLDKALIRPGRVDMIVKFDKADGDMTAAIFRAIFAPLEGDDAPPSKVAGDKYADVAEALAAERRMAAERKKQREAIMERVEVLATEFAARIPAHEFSPAELQGYLLKNKRDPEAAVKGVDEWVVETRKDKKEKELKAAEEKRKKEEEEKKEKEKKEKEEKEAKEKEEAEKKKAADEEAAKKKKEEKKARKKAGKRKGRKSSSKKKERSDSESGSDSDSDSSESEGEGKKTKADEKEKDAAAKTETPVVVVPPPSTLKTEESNKTVVADVTEKAASEKVEGVAVVDDGKQQQGADSGYGTP